MKNETNKRTDGDPAVGCSELLGLVFQSVRFSKPILFLLFVFQKCAKSICLLALKPLKISEFRIVINRAHVACLKRGYLAPDECNLGSNFSVTNPP